MEVAGVFPGSLQRGHDGRVSIAGMDILIDIYAMTVIDAVRIVLDACRLDEAGLGYDGAAIAVRPYAIGVPGRKAKSQHGGCV